VTRALVIVLGALSTLPTDRARKRILDFITDRLDEAKEDHRFSGHVLEKGKEVEIP
jgi:hypothetical protein